MLTISRAVSAGQALDDDKKALTKSVPGSNYYRESMAKFRACRVSRAVRMVKESLRPETIQLGRWKEFFRPQVTV